MTEMMLFYERFFLPPQRSFTHPYRLDFGSGLASKQRAY